MFVRSFILVFACVIFLFIGLPPAQADTVVVSHKSQFFANVREEPKRSSTKLGKLEKDGQAELIENLRRWRKVRLEDGTVGFVTRRWTRVIGDLPERQEDELRIHFLPVGAGSCTVVECPGSDAHPLIYDCGENGGLGDMALDDDGAKMRVERILGAHSVKPDVVVSHGDRDHYSLISTVLADIQSRSIWVGADAGEYQDHGFPSWLSDQESNGATVRKNLGRHFHNDGEPLGNPLSCGAADVYVLTNSSSDPSTGGSKDNADSLMLMIEYEEFSTIFSGDAEGETEQQARDNYGDTLQTTVLMSSHHGSKSNQSNSPDWVDTTKPDVVVHTAGGRFGHPACVATRRFQPYLKSVPEHSAVCDASSSSGTWFESELAEYMTHAVGTVVVTTNGKSPLHIWCEGGKGCDTHIDY